LALGGSGAQALPRHTLQYTGKGLALGGSVQQATPRHRFHTAVSTKARSDKLAVSLALGGSDRLAPTRHSETSDKTTENKFQQAIIAPPEG
jgi:hypothetical protein